MQALTFEIRLSEPLLAAQTQSGEPNSATSYPFIPGSVIRGALIRRYLRDHAANVAGSEMQTLFFNGTVCYLNAYPAYPLNRTRLLPKPLSWFVTKDKEENADASIQDFAIQAPGENENGSFKSPRGDFYWRGTATAQLGSPAMRTMVHNASSERSRKSVGLSQVYRYDTIDAGEIFAGAICSADASQLEKLQPLLAGIFHFGGSHTAGYGTVEICQVSDPDGWTEYSPDPGAATDSQFVTLTCLSDVILRGKHGQADNDLAALVGASPSEVFHRMRLVGGFNRTWGLPLPQAWAIEMGSVFVFESTHRSVLEQLAARGIGERRAEGFGRVAVNLNLQTTLEQSKMPRRPIKPADSGELSPISRPLAETMAERKLQVQLERHLIARVNALTADGELKNLPSPAQLARVQLVARQAWQTGNLGLIAEHFRDLSKLSQRQWETARIGVLPLREWLEGQAQHPTEFDPGKFQVTVAGVSVSTQDVRAKMVARLLEGVLKQAVKTAKRQREGGRK